MRPGGLRRQLRFAARRFRLGLSDQALQIDFCPPTTDSRVLPGFGKDKVRQEYAPVATRRTLLLECVCWLPGLTAGDTPRCFKPGVVEIP
jgi:hypothetical protein